jgi:hypothetical protein
MNLRITVENAPLADANFGWFVVPQSDYRPKIPINIGMRKYATSPMRPAKIIFGQRPGICISSQTKNLNIAAEIRSIMITLTK